MRILFDSTFSTTSGKSTGIERVVSSLRREALADEVRPGESVLPVVFVEQSIIELNEVANSCLTDAFHLRKAAVASSSWRYRVAAQTICKLLPIGGLRRYLLPAPGHLGIFKKKYQRMQREGRRAAIAASAEIRPSHGDIIFLPDAYWATHDIWPTVRVARDRGALVVGLVYDLIPLTECDSQGQPLPPNPHFVRYLQALIRHADLILTISQSVERQLREHLRCNGNAPQSPPMIDAIKLGCEISHRPHGEMRQSPTDCDVRSELVCFLNSQSSGPSYLCVGTLEPRKNYNFILDAFEQLWNAGGEQRLLIVGRVGWQCEPLVARIQGHRRLSNKLIWLQDASDSELAFAYQNCDALITASLAEGFGLPIVEAAWYGKPVLANDIPIHREVGGGFAHFFDVGNASNLVAAIAALEQIVPTGKSVDSAQLPLTTWANCWSDCTAKIRRHYALHAFKNDPAIPPGSAWNDC